MKTNVKHQNMMNSIIYGQKNKQENAIYIVHIDLIYCSLLEHNVNLAKIQKIENRLYTCNDT